MRYATKPLPPQVRIVDTGGKPTAEFHRWLMAAETRWPSVVIEDTALVPPDYALPALVGTTTAGTATYSTQGGSFSRIGEQVAFSLELILTAKGTMAGNARVTGLPYPAQVATFVHVGHGSVNVPTAAQVIGIIPVGQTYIDLYQQQANTALVPLATTVIQNTTRLYISGSYTAQPIEG